MKLRMRVATTFMQRLRGVHAAGPLAPDEGLLIQPCKAVHTFFLSQALDVVFLDAAGRECRCIHDLAPFQVAGAAASCMVVELPAGYCRRHPDYLAHISAAMQLRVSTRLPK